MKVSYIIDTSCGLADVPYPGAAAAQDFTAGTMAEAVAAEKAGFDGVFVPGRHGRGGAVLPNPLTLLAAISSVTTHVRLGTYVLVAPYYDPRKIAEETAMLDLLSNGRFTFGVGRGGSWEPDILEASGVDPSMRTARFEETLRVVKQLWRGESVTTDAAGLNYKDVTIFPRPVQDPHPPIWVGAMADSAIIRAAELGDAWCLDPFPIDMESWKRRTDLYRETAERAGKTPKIVLMRDAFLADTREEAEQRYASVVVEEYRQYFDWGLFAHVPGIDVKDDVNVKNLTPHMTIGTADDCLADLEWCKNELGVDEVVLCSRRPAGPDTSYVQESIRGFGSDVLPRL